MEAQSGYPSSTQVVDLDATTGIGDTTALKLAAASISADTTDGDIGVDNTLADDVAVSNLTSGGIGDIWFDQSGNGAVAFTTVTIRDGTITLTNTKAGLSVSGAITAGGTDKNLTLTTTGSGDITLTGTTTATDDKVWINAAGAIKGSGLVTVNTVDFDACTGVWRQQQPTQHHRGPPSTRNRQ